MTRKGFLGLFLTPIGLCLAVGVARADVLLVPKGTIVPVALLKDISTASVKEGDVIKAVYTGDEDGGFPEGTIFVAKVTSAAAKSEKSSGSVRLEFTQGVLPGNKGITISGKPVNAKPSSGKKNKKKDTGTGAAIGAGAGMLIGGNNVAGALLGGAAGALVGNKTGDKPKDLTFKKGSAFGIELLAAAKIPQK